ncbi:hypothetical protein BGW80DRAFT_1348481 [Lactifluus volemus]|nr:hypothetical protein BGW80DRAFT_1348481 [Lactifluus volemus]
MPCASSTSSQRQWTRETGYPPASSMDSTTTNCAYMHLSQRPTWILQLPPLMIPLRTSSIDLALHHHKRTSKSDTRNSQLQLRDARRHARLEPTHGLHLLPNPRILLFRWAPTPSHSNLRYPPHSRVLAPLHPARLGDACSLHRRYRCLPRPRSS